MAAETIQRHMCKSKALVCSHSLHLGLKVFGSLPVIIAPGHPYIEGATTLSNNILLLCYSIVSQYYSFSTLFHTDVTCTHIGSNILTADDLI